MIEIKDVSKCCGCSACFNICPHRAITMVPDSLGFLYPSVNKSLCTDCGLCEKVCSFNEDYDKSQNFDCPQSFAVRHKELMEVRKSRSGAAFVALSNYIIDRGGVVYGAGFKDGFKVCHKRATTFEQRDEFRGSKYVQSEIGDVFKQVKSDLRDERIVLFSGTPCQTSGLNSFVGKKLRKNLYLVDIVCHGTSSPKVWSDYLAHIEEMEGNRIVRLNFRNKSLFGWNAHKETFEFENGETKWYRYRFYNELHIRKSCNSCPYSNTTRPSDITIGDLWGYEKTVPSMQVDNQGCSMVYCNTEKGRELLEMIKQNIIITEIPLEFTIQPNLINPTRKHRNRDAFEKTYTEKGFHYAARKFGMIGYRYYIDKIIGFIQNML